MVVGSNRWLSVDKNCFYTVDNSEYVETSFQFHRWRTGNEHESEIWGSSHLYLSATAYLSLSLRRPSVFISVGICCRKISAAKSRSPRALWPLPALTTALSFDTVFCGADLRAVHMKRYSHYSYTLYGMLL